MLSLLSDYETYDDMHESLFTEGFDGFENEPFVKQLSEVNKGVIMNLI